MASTHSAARRSRTAIALTYCGVVILTAPLVSCTAPVPRATATSGTATDDPTETLQRLADQPEQSPLEPGRYVMSMPDAPSTPMLPVITVPEGYSHSDDGQGVYTSDPGPDGYGPGLDEWNIEEVYTHPCAPDGHPEPVGPEVTDLADALVAQPLRNASTPTPVTVGGYGGVYLELSVPDDIDISSCPGGRFNSWPGRWQQGPGQKTMMWILDVEGQRLELEARHGPSATPDEIRELTDIVSGITFTAP
jgi:hypothetical protein